MKKLICTLLVAFIAHALSAQENTTAKGAYDAVCKYLSVFDTTNAFPLLRNKVGDKLIKGVRKSVKEDTPEEFKKKVEDCKVVFTSMSLLNTIETDSLVAFNVKHKKKVTSTTFKDSYLIFKKINNLWYLVMFDDDEDDILRDFPAFEGKIVVPEPKDEKIKE